MRNWLLLMLGFLPLSSLVGQAFLQQPVSFTERDQPLAALLQTLERAGGVPVYFQASQLPTGRYDFVTEQLPFQTALSQLLSPYGLGFSVYEGHAIIIGPIEQLQRSYNREYFLSQYQQAITVVDTLKESAMLLVGEGKEAPPNGIAIVTGTVLDRDADRPIEGAAVQIPQRNLILRTDRVGEFVLRLPPGDYSLRINANTYEPFEKLIRVFASGEIEFELDMPYYSLDAVELSARSAEANIRSVQPGIIQLNVREIKELPAFLGEADLVKGLLIQPGVSTVGEGASGFNVRGGNIDQNLIMQDGAMIFNSSHILGFFSVFNTDAVENLTLYKGHIPASFGGRTASVLDVKSKTGNFKKLKGEGGLGLISARMLLDGPIVKDKTAFVVGVRSFYPSWILPAFDKQPEISQSGAFFVDGNVKIDHQFSETSFLSLSVYNSFDFFRYSNEYGFDWSTQMGSLEWRKLMGNHWSATAHLSGGSYRSGLFVPEGPGAFRLQTGIRNARFSQKFLYSPSNETRLEMGVEEVFYQMRPQELTPRGEGSAIGFRSVEGEQGLESAVFVNLELPLGDFFAFSAGLRASAFQNLGPGTAFLYAEGQARQEGNIVDTLQYEPWQNVVNYMGLEPRASLRYLVDENSSIKLSYGRHRQYLHLLSNTSAATPVDIWQMSNPYVAPQVSDNYSAGYFRNFVNGAWEAGMDFYYRDMTSVVEYKDLPELLLNPHLETELVQGLGRAYGVELSLKKNTGTWQGDLSYTFARSLRQASGDFSDEVINLGNWYPSNFDSPHNLNLSLRRKVRKSQLLAINFVYRQGRPITAPVADYFIGSVNVPHYSPRNLFRIPDYHRLDLAYTFKPNLIKRQSLKSDFTVGVYNFYFRKNPFSLFFRKSPTGVPETYRLAILGAVFPSFTWNFRF